MAKINTNLTLPTPLDERRYGGNGDIPASNALRRAAHALNHASVAQRKMVATVAHATQSTPAPSSSSQDDFQFVFRTGENVESVSAEMLLAPQETAQSGQPSVQLRLYDGSTTLEGNVCNSPAQPSALYSPDQVQLCRSTIVTGLLPNTEYRGYLRQINFARIHSATVHETAYRQADSDVDGVVNSLLYNVGGHITDTNIGDLLAEATLLYKHNGAHLLSYSQADQASPVYINSTSNVNILTGSANTWSASTPGYVLNTQYHNTQTNTDLPVTLGIYATRASGTGTLTVEIVRNGGTVLSETITASGTNPFASSQHEITARASDKVDIVARCSDGSTQWVIWSMGVWEYIP